MATDWRDALAALRGDVPEAEADDTSNAADQADAPAKAQTAPLHVSVERKGRKGKTATIIDGFEVDDDTVAEVARQLKQKIGTGGSSRGGEILLQGEWRERAAELLRGMGYKVKG